MKTALERFLEKLSPPSLEALPVTLMLLPHVNQLDKVLCTSVYARILADYNIIVNWVLLEN